MTKNDLILGLTLEVTSLSGTQPQQKIFLNSIEPLIKNLSSLQNDFDRTIQQIKESLITEIKRMNNITIKNGDEGIYILSLERMKIYIFDYQIA